MSLAEAVAEALQALINRPMEEAAALASACSPSSRGDVAVGGGAHLKRPAQNATSEPDASLESEPK